LAFFAAMTARPMTGSQSGSNACAEGQKAPLTLSTRHSKARRKAPVYDSVEHTNSFTLLALNIKARFAELTDWLGPDPARCFDCPVDPAPAEQ
jgi:hypothetical protein